MSDLKLTINQNYKFWNFGYHFKFCTFGSKFGFDDPKNLWISIVDISDKILLLPHWARTILFCLPTKWLSNLKIQKVIPIEILLLFLEGNYVRKDTSITCHEGALMVSINFLADRHIAAEHWTSFRVNKVTKISESELACSERVIPFTCARTGILAP